MTVSSRGYAKILMILEAFFGSFFISVVTGLYIPMLTYSGYPLSQVSFISLFTALLSLAAAYTIYRYPETVVENAKKKLLLFHALQRFIWMAVPYTISNPLVAIAMYALANVVSIPVGILLNIALLDVFQSEVEYMEVIVGRTAFGSAASILGYLFTMYTTMFIQPPQSYYISYTIGPLAGLLATLSLIPYRMSKDFRERSYGGFLEEVEIRKTNTFVMLSLMMSAANIIGLAWPQTLKSLGASIYIAVALNLAGAIGGVIGPYIWRGYRGYVTAMATNALFSISIPFIPWIYGHVVLSGVLSATFVGANLIASSIYSRYVKSIGMVKSSAFLVAANYVGLFIASLVGMYISNPMVIYSVSTSLRLLALAVVLLAIPETAIARPERVYEYGRLVYTASILGYTIAVEASHKILRIFIEILILSMLIALMVFLYRLVYIFALGV